MVVNHAGASKQGKQVLALFFSMRGETPIPHDRWRRCARTGRMLRAVAWRLDRPLVALNLIRHSSRPALDRAFDEATDEEFKKRKSGVAAPTKMAQISSPPERPECSIKEVDGLHFVTASDDEKDFMAAQDYYNLCDTGRQPAGPAPSGYWKPIGQFSEEEEVKIYHSMFEHIIGVDGFCVYPHCRKPKEDFNLERSLFLGDRYADCLQKNWDKLEKSRIALQDAEYAREVLERIAQNPKPLGPPDFIEPMVPRKKKNRHPKKHKPRDMALPPGSGIIHEISDLRRSNCLHNFTTHLVSRLDSICNEVVILESVSEDLARLAVDPRANFDYAGLVPVPNFVAPTSSRGTPNPSPLTPLPSPPPTTTTNIITTTTTTTTTPRPHSSSILYDVFGNVFDDAYGNVVDDDDVDSDDCEPDDYSYS